MEFGERKRSRKSQSFKLLSAEGRCFSGHWVGEEGMEIKRQITGMMKILSDRSGRGYQRVGPGLSQDAGEDGGQSAPLQLPDDDHTWASEDEIAPSTLSSTLTNGPGTRSRAQRGLHCVKDMTKALEVNGKPQSAEAPCCMCNCKDTLQAILQELQVMRKMMQAEKGKFTKCTSLIQRQSIQANQNKHGDTWTDVLQPSLVKMGYQLLSKFTGYTFNICLLSLYSLLFHIHQTVFFILFQPEVRLVEDYDVFISKAQLDSILINYTRSGSLLFRKLVCVPSLMMPLWPTLCPMGREKEGSMTTEKVRLQYNTFTEKYCIEHKIEKLPGPRDWVQILQDQIKLARRRLRRGQLSVHGDREYLLPLFLIVCCTLVLRCS
uniref:Uncharacterized protein n=1 Tax=Periophthalmus magnuspinnatus TaxID=409849 RepID=A0A3B4AVL6_9GOBI